MRSNSTNNCSVGTAVTQVTSHRSHLWLSRGAGSACYSTGEAWDTEGPATCLGGVSPNHMMTVKGFCRPSGGVNYLWLGNRHLTTATPKVSSLRLGFYQDVKVLWIKTQVLCRLWLNFPRCERWVSYPQSVTNSKIFTGLRGNMRLMLGWAKQWTPYSLCCKFNQTPGQPQWRFSVTVNLYRDTASTSIMGSVTMWFIKKAFNTH